MNLTVLSVGGSIIAPDKVDTEFLKAFRSAIVDYLKRNPLDKLIFVTGGGAPARIWQSGYREVREEGDTGRILVAGGWKPGFSTDTDAVYLAKKFGGKLVVNLSNIAKVYTDDPRKNPDAKPIDSISWKDFRAMVGDEWVPGKNTPFDPIASKLAEEGEMRVICADGRNIENTLAILEGKEFFGTIIGA